MKLLRNMCNECKHTHERRKWAQNVKLQVVFCADCDCKRWLIDQSTYGSGHSRYGIVNPQ